MLITLETLHLYNPVSHKKKISTDEEFTLYALSLKSSSFPCIKSRSMQRGLRQILNLRKKKDLLIPLSINNREVCSFCRNGIQRQ